MHFSQKISVALASVVLLFAGTAASAEAASPTQVAQVAQVAQATTVTSSVLTSTSVTHSCSTGGYWYMTDTVYVTQTYVSGGKYQYAVTRSPNREVTVDINGTYHYVHHTGVALNQYSAGTVYKKANPPTTTYLYSQYSTDDFGVWFNVTDYATMNVHTGCYVYF